MPYRRILCCILSDPETGKNQQDALWFSIPKSPFCILGALHGRFPGILWGLIQVYSDAGIHHDPAIMVVLETMNERETSEDDGLP